MADPRSPATRPLRTAVPPPERGLFFDDEEYGAAPPPGSWRGRPPLSLRFGNPTRVFRALAEILAPVAPLRYLILPLVALSGTAAVFNWYDLEAHLTRIAFSMTFLQSFLLGLLTTNFLAKVFQGIVMGHYGADCDELGFRLAFGIIPKFYIFKGAIRELDFPQQRQCYAAPLLFRLAMFGVGVLIWTMLLPTGSGLATVALALGIAGLSSFLGSANPLWPADGYRWLSAWLERPKLRTHGFKILGLVLRFRPLPPDLPWSEFWLLILYAVLSLAFTAFIIFSMVTTVAFGLEQELRGTGVIIFCFMLAALGVFLFSKFEKRRSGGRRKQRATADGNRRGRGQRAGNEG